MSMRILILFILLSFQSVSQTEEYDAMLQTYYDSFPTISSDSALLRIHDKDVFFLDTRERNEYRISHIENAIYVGYDNFSMKRIRWIPKDKEIIVYCSIGARSQTIGKRLMEEGYTNVRNLYGGLFQWCNEEKPMVKVATEPTDEIHGYSHDWGKWIEKGKIVY